MNLFEKLFGENGRLISKKEKEKREEIYRQEFNIFYKQNKGLIDRLVEDNHIIKPYVDGCPSNELIKYRMLYYLETKKFYVLMNRIEDGTEKRAYYYDGIKFIHVATIDALNQIFEFNRLDNLVNGNFTPQQEKEDYNSLFIDILEWSKPEYKPNFNERYLVWDIYY